jgi:hypothetical protein
MRRPGVQLYRQDLEETAKTLQIKLKIQARTDLARLGQQLTPASAILLFLGGTPELLQFTQV